MMQPVRKKHVLQKVAGVTGILCFIAAVVCTLVLFIYAEDFSKVYKASFAASSFFFFSVGIVLNVIASTHLPNFYGNTPKD